MVIRYSEVTEDPESCFNSIVLWGIPNGFRRIGESYLVQPTLLCEPRLGYLQRRPRKNSKFVFTEIQTSHSRLPSVAVDQKFGHPKQWVRVRTIEYSHARIIESVSLAYISHAVRWPGWIHFTFALKFPCLACLLITFLKETKN